REGPAVAAGHRTRGGRHGVSGASPAGAAVRQQRSGAGLRRYAAHRAAPAARRSEPLTRPGRKGVPPVPTDPGLAAAYPRLFAPQRWEWGGLDAQFTTEAPADALVTNVHVVGFSGDQVIL